MKLTNPRWQISLFALLTTLGVGSASASARAEPNAGFGRHHTVPVHHGNHARHWHHGHHQPRLTLSVAPIYRPWVYPPHYYDPFFYRSRWNDRPIIIEQAAPQVYIEQPQMLAQPAPMQAPDTNNYWYFCESAQAYFPYVNECAGGWQRVVPQPPPPPVR